MKRIKKKIVSFLVILLSLPFIGTNLYSQAGGAAVPFLLISPDARASGMGEVGTAIADDINAIYWNPAGLAFHTTVPSSDEQIPFRQISITFSKWLPQFNADLFYSYATLGQYFKEIDGTVAFNFVFMNLGEFTRTYENGQIGPKFLSNEFSIGLSYGTIIAEDLGVGFQLRYIHSNLAPVSAFTQGDAGVGQSGSFDLGFLWKPTKLDIFGLDLEDRLSLGLNLQNVGPKMTYRKMSDPLPTTLRVGTAFKVVEDEFNKLLVGIDMSKLLVRREGEDTDPLPKSLITGWKNPGVELAFGAEYWYQEIVALRAGYFTEPSALGNRKYYNFGAGVRYSMFQLDFSFINTVEENHPLANTMRFSLLIDWR